MTTKTFAESLEELRAVLEAQTIERPDIVRFVPLLALVREKCPCLSIEEVDGINHAYDLNGCKSCYVQGRTNLRAGHSNNCQCEGSSYTTRTAYWEAAAPGALDGAFIKALFLVNSHIVFIHAARRIRRLVRTLVDMLEARDVSLDTRLFAVKAVLEWAKELP